MEPPCGSRRQRLRSATARRAEDLVAGRLAATGWTVLARNLRVGRSELDLVATDPGPPAAFVVVEVRASRSSSFGPVEERVGPAKLRAVYRGAIGLLRSGRLPDGRLLPRLPLRVDLVVVELAPALGRDLGGSIVRHLRGVIGHASGDGVPPW